MLTINEAKALVITARLAASFDTPATQAEIDTWAAKMDGANTDQVIAEYVNQPDFVALRKTLRAVCAGAAFNVANLKTLL